MARRRQAVTIKHVAADADVSLQTVSRVINNEPNVSVTTKAKVEASITKLGYVPSIAAQRMSGSKSYLILALNDRERTIAQWQARDGNDWVDQMLLGGMLTCAKHGYRMLIELVDTRDEHVEREVTAAIAALQPDGIILTPPHSHNPKIVGLLVSKRIPFVRMGSHRDDQGIPVRMDDEGAARMATEHLIKAGHARIGFITGSAEYSESMQRIVGWKSVMAEHDLSIGGLLAEGDFSLISGETATRQLLDGPDRATAIIASNDQMALGALNVAKEGEIDVPRDLSIVSFENSPGVRLCQPPLTAIDQPVAAMTAKAVNLLISSQAGADLPEGPSVEAAQLISRASVAPPPKDA
ncbi:MAG: LacI family DNA-binding transcriptional regulator [Pseudomonadota bacterium]